MIILANRFALIIFVKPLGDHAKQLKFSTAQSTSTTFTQVSKENCGDFPVHKEKAFIFRAVSVPMFQVSVNLDRCEILRVDTT